MIALEYAALIAMALVFVLTFVGSARSHTRARAWQVPTIVAQSGRSDGAGSAAVIDARDRFRTNSLDREDAPFVAEAA